MKQSDWSDVEDASFVDAEIEIKSILASLSVHHFCKNAYERLTMQAVHTSLMTLEDVLGRFETRRLLLASYCEPAFSLQEVLLAWYD